MRLSGRRSKKDRDDGVLPLINIIFLLLIFFLIAGKLRAPDAFEVIPPEGEAQERVEAAGPLVLVGADGGLALDGEQMEEAALLSALRARFQTEGAQKLRVKADADADAAEVAALLARLGATGPTQTSLIITRSAAP